MFTQYWPFTLALRYLCMGWRFGATRHAPVDDFRAGSRQGLRIFGLQIRYQPFTNLAAQIPCRRRVSCADQRPSSRVRSFASLT